MKKIFIDTDIILDLLTGRVPFYIHAAMLFSKIDTNEYKACTSSAIVSNLFYILRKELGSKEAKKIIGKLLTVITILPVNEKVIRRSLQSDFADLKDAIQYYTAIEENISILITRNTKDFKPAKISILTAEEFLSG